MGYLWEISTTNMHNQLLSDYLTEPASKKANPHCIKNTTHPITIKKNAFMFSFRTSKSSANTEEFEFLFVPESNLNLLLPFSGSSDSKIFFKILIKCNSDLRRCIYICARLGKKFVIFQITQLFGWK